MYSVTGMVPALFQKAEQEDKELNFENSDSIKHQNLAHEDLISAKVLANASKKDLFCSDRKVKKALCRKVKQVAMETVEHAQKAVVCADEKNKKIKDKQKHKILETTHNNFSLQRGLEQAGVSLISKQDVLELNSGVRGRNSPYNAVRYYNQNISDKCVDNAIRVAEKAVAAMDDMVEKNKKDLMVINGLEYCIEFDKVDS